MCQTQLAQAKLALPTIPVSALPYQVPQSPYPPSYSLSTGDAPRMMPDTENSVNIWMHFSPFFLRTLNCLANVRWSEHAGPITCFPAARVPQPPPQLRSFDLKEGTQIPLLPKVSLPHDTPQMEEPLPDSLTQLGSWVLTDDLPKACPHE